MPKFTKIDDVTDLATYKTVMKNLLTGLSAGRKAAFFYTGNFEFDGGKKGPLLLMDFAPALIKSLKEQTDGKTAEGECAKDDDGGLAFRVTKGAVKEENFTRKLKDVFKVEARVMQANSTPDEEKSPERQAKEGARLEKEANAKKMVLDVEKQLKAEVDSHIRKAKEFIDKSKPLLAEAVEKRKSFDAQVKAAKAAGKSDEAKALEKEQKAWFEKARDYAEAIKNNESLLRELQSGSHLKKYQASAVEWSQRGALSEFALGEAKMFLGRLADTHKILEEAEHAYEEFRKAMIAESVKKGSSGKSEEDLEKLKETYNKAAGVLDAEVWSIGVNDSFMKGGASKNAVFELKSDFGSFTTDLLAKRVSGAKFMEALTPIGEEAAPDPKMWDAANKRLAVSARELAQLLDAGYIYDKSKRTLSPAKA